MQKAEHEAWKTDVHGTSEEDIPERTLRTVVSPPAGTSGKMGAAPPSNERRDLPLSSQTNILPVVEEAAEHGSTGERSRNSQISSVMSDGRSEIRPLTPAKDGEEREAGFGNPLLRGPSTRGRGPPPPTPPKTGYNGHGDGTVTTFKPQSADSGYGFTGSNGSSSSAAGPNGTVGLKSASGSQKSLNGNMIRPQFSRDSLDKALPPLPSTVNSSAAGIS